MEIGTYRDGGTKSFTFPAHQRFFGEHKEVTICLDNRILSDTIGDWYMGYPSSGRLLTDKEKNEVIPVIINNLRKDFERSKYLFEKIHTENKAYTFLSNFNRDFNLKGAASGKGISTVSYISVENDFTLDGVNDKFQLRGINPINKDNILVEGTKKECYRDYKSLINKK